MFRKIPYNPAPADGKADPDLLTELKNEFQRYVDAVTHYVAVLLKKYPKPAYAFMILLMLGSMILSFTVFRNHADRKSITVKSIAQPLQNGFGQIMEKGAAFQQMIMLKQQIEALIAQDTLSQADSLKLSAAIDQLQQLSSHSSN